MSGEEENPTSIEAVIVDHLDQADLRWTSARRALIGALRSAGRPLALPELLELAPKLAQSSAYRNLAQLEEVGVVRRLMHGDEHAYYELAESLTEHHHHLICEGCGEVRDITFDADLERQLDGACEQVAAAEGFTISRHVIDLFGRCSTCR